MSQDIIQRLLQVQPKIHGATIGMTLGLGTMFINQGCPAPGL